MKKAICSNVLMFCFCFSIAITSAQNTPPIVKAGVDQLILLSGSATLAGSVTDDGLPGPLSITWLFVSGPGTVSFSNASTLNSSATFSAPGTYYLRLRANDGQYTRFDTVRIAVRAKATDRKCNMGNYVAYVSKVTKAEIINTAILPGVAGVHKRYKWRDLEPTQGNYNFTSIQADLDILSTLGKQLVSMVTTKSFDTSDVVTPDYLSSYVAMFGPNFKGTYGYSIALWQPVVVTRLKLLLDTLAKTFDTHPNFEGVATQETALGSPWNPSMASFGYTAEKYRDAMIDILTGASNSFNQSSIFWYMNFMPDPFPWKENYLADVAHAVAPLGALRAGGPDVLPDDKALKTRTYRLYDSLVGKVPLFCSNQNDSYRHLHADTVNYSTKYWTLQEIVDFARSDLHVNYLFWNYKTWKTAGQPDEYDFDDAKPVMANNPIHNLELSNPLAAGTITGLKTVCQGKTNVTYSVPTIINATDYIWSYSGTGVTISGTTNPVTINFSSTATSGNLKVMGSNCCSNGAVSANYAINVNPILPASISTEASPSNTICLGNNVIFTATPSNGGDTPIYQWKLNWANVGTNSATYSNSSLANGDIVRCVLTSNATCVTGSPAKSNIVTMTVYAIPAKPIITQNGNVLTSSAATGNQWYLDGTPITGATDSTYTVTIDGTYTVVVTVNGCSSSSSLPLTIITTGITEANENYFIAIHPNPFTTNFTLKISSEIIIKDAVMKIYDVYGKEVKNSSINSREIIIERDELGEGIYFYSILNNNESIGKGKLVVQ